MKKERAYLIISIMILSLFFTGMVMILIYKRNHIPDELNSAYSIASCDPDDELSENILKELGNSFVYQGHYEDKNNVNVYEFYICTHDEDTISFFHHTINQYIELTDGKTQMTINDGSGEWGATVVFYNFSSESMREPDYNGYDRIYVTGYLLTDYWNDPNNYLNLNGIRILAMQNMIEENAQKAGIDWFDVWPNLEKIYVLDWSDYSIIQEINREE